MKSEGGYTIAGGAPFVADGKVIVTGNRPDGFIQAYDAETGKYLWTWSALPKPGEPAYATWGGATLRRCARSGSAGSFDPELSLIYYGTGQPNPRMEQGKDAAGDNLYSEADRRDRRRRRERSSGIFRTRRTTSTIGTRSEIPVLVDASVPRTSRASFSLQANRNGFYYVLDRTNGAVSPRDPVCRSSWTGRPDSDPGRTDRLLRLATSRR